MSGGQTGRKAQIFSTDPLSATLVSQPIRIFLHILRTRPAAKQVVLHLEAAFIAKPLGEADESLRIGKVCPTQFAK